MKTLAILTTLALFVLVIWSFERNWSTSPSKDSELRKKQDENFIKSGIDKMHISKSMRGLMDMGVSDSRTQVYAFVLGALGVVFGFLLD